MKKNPGLFCSLIFLATFLLMFLALQMYVKNINEAYKEETKDQTEIILSNVSSRLKLFMDLPLMLGKMGSEHFQEYELNQKNLNELCEGLFQTNRDILGLNLVNSAGKIVAVYPRSENYRALGKSTQNIANLRRSLANDEEFWFSQPFKLYQEGEGFGMYVPIRKGKTLRGWFAVMMNTHSFIADFNIDRLMKHYEINIIDDQSRQPFLQTSLFTPSGKNHRIFSEIVHGRNLTYVIWPKKKFKTPISNTEILLISLFFAFIAFFLSSLFRYKRETQARIEEMTHILKLTHQDAMEKLIDLQAEFYKLGANENIRYVHQMIEQLEVIQNSIHAHQRIDDTDEEVISVLKQELENQSHIIKKKSLLFNTSIIEGKHVHFRTNSWLFRNSVISNIITHSVLLAMPGTSLTVSLNAIPGKCILLFRLQQTLHFGFEGEVQEFDNHLEVARKVMHFYNGDVTCDKDLAGGLLIRVYIPHVEKNYLPLLKWFKARHNRQDKAYI